MKKSSAVKLAATMLALLAGFVTLQAYWVAQMDLPYELQALLAVSAGMILGYAASILLIVWKRAGSRSDGESGGARSTTPPASAAAPARYHRAPAREA